MELGISYKGDEQYNNLCYECEKIAKQNHVTYGGALKLLKITYISDCIIYVGEENKIIAYTAIGIHGNDLYINQIAVTPEHKRQGVGSEMLRQLAEMKKRNTNDSYNRVLAHVFTDNIASKTMFERNGYNVDECMSTSKRLFFTYDVPKLIK